jgi:hypothetical protein
MLQSSRGQAIVEIVNGIGVSLSQFESAISDLDHDLTQILEHVPSGIYYVRMRSGDVMIREKIIKE